MKNFLDSVAKKRESEIRIIKSKGYSYSSSYKFYDSFLAIQESFNFKEKIILFRGTNETWFLLLSEEESDNKIKNTSLYYSIIDLLDLINDCDKSHRISKWLAECECTGVIKIIYDGEIYYCPFPRFDEEQKTYINSLDRGIIKFIILLSLIQGKSNCYFEKQADYKYGLFRFFNVYSNLKQDSAIMQNRGWYYNISDDKFVLEADKFLIKAIVLRFKGEKELIDLEEFRKELSNKNLSGKKNLIANRFLKRYGAVTGKFYKYSEIKKNPNLFVLDHDFCNKKELKRIINMKSWLDSDTDYYTKKPLATGPDSKTMILLISRTNKKYYLTKSEMDEIIKLSPRKSSV